MEKEDRSVSLQPTQDAHGNVQPTTTLPLEKEANLDHTKIKPITNFQSSFWRLALPMLSAMTAIRWVSHLFRLDKAPTDNGKDWFLRRGYGFAVAGAMAIVTGSYAFRIHKDMQQVFKETVAWELNKDPKDVSSKDMLNSQNAIIKTTYKNYFKHNLRRVAFVNLPFLNFLIPGVLEKPGGDSPNKKVAMGMDIHDSVYLGTGVAAGYLASDSFLRKVSFFEALQDFMEKKIKQTDSLDDRINARDLINLYELHVRDNDPDASFKKDKGTEKWDKDLLLFDRMANLMNQTYANITKTEQANFTIPKFIYLLGEGLVTGENMATNHAYVEIANSYGIEAVKQSVKKIHQGIPLSEIIKEYPVTIPSELLSAPREEESPATTKYTSMAAVGRKPIDKIATTPQGTFADKTAATLGTGLAHGV